MENFSELLKVRRSMRKFTDEELTQGRGGYSDEGCADVTHFQADKCMAVYYGRR